MKLEPLALDGMPGLIAAIILGACLGFTLVKSDLAWDECCVPFMALKNGKILKTILMTFAMGTVGFYFAARAGLVHFQVAPAYTMSAVIGGVLSGIGLALAGFFPSGSVAALGAGRLYALWVLLGMVLVSPAKRLMTEFIDTPWNWGREMTAPHLASEAFGISNWIWPLAVGAVVLTAIVQFLLPDDDE